VNRHHQPFRVQRRRDAVPWNSCRCSLSGSAASGAELKVKVVDPHSAAVSGAQVILLNGQTQLPCR
jgi:hypothetical protein